MYLLPLVITGAFDRYYIPALPLLAAAIAAIAIPRRLDAAAGRSGRAFAAALLTIYSLLSICFVRDYLEWNRLRRQAMNDLLNVRNVPAAEIDGGFEYNGLCLFDPAYLHDPDYGKKNPDHFWWWRKNNSYMLAVGRIPGYDVIKEYGYYRWAPPRLAKVVVLRKQAQPGAGVYGTATATR